jgi:hypothetical protein
MGGEDMAEDSMTWTDRARRVLGSLGSVARFVAGVVLGYGVWLLLAFGLSALISYLGFVVAAALVIGAALAYWLVERNILEDRRDTAAFLLGVPVGPIAVIVIMCGSIVVDNL